ncbi:MAG: hypothetical protein GY810_00890 [Aureispira sp.]|nr:hypothetical protein [Aureispira sp.]
MEFLMLPKSKYLENATLEELHNISKQHTNELEFWAQELSFLQKMLDKHLITIIHQEDMQHTQDLINRIDDIEGKRKKLQTAIQEHEHYLKNLLENPFSHDAQVYREEHNQIEKLVFAFNQQYKSLKSDLFQVIEHARHPEEDNKMLE